MKKQKKQGLLKKFLITNVRMLLVIHQKQFTIYSVIKYLFFVLGQLQSAFFYLYPCATASKTIYHNFYIVFLIRPDLIITNPRMLDLSDLYGFIIPLGFFIFFDILVLQYQVIYQLTKGKESDNLHNQIDLKGSFQKFLINCKSLYSQLFVVYLYIPAQTLCIQSFSESRSSENIHYEISILSVVTIILLLITQMIKVIVSNTSIDLIIRGYERIYFSKSDFLRELIIIIQIILFTIIQNEKTASITQGILSIFVAITYLSNCFSDNNIIQEIFTKLVVSIQPSIIAIIAFSIIYRWEEGLIIIPLFIWLGINEAYKLQGVLYGKIMVEKNLKNITSFIALVVNEYRNNDRKMSQVAQATVLYHHKLKCHDLLCFCQQQHFSTTNGHNLLYLSDKLKSKFILSKIKIWNKNISLSKNKSSASACLQYISCLSHFGFTVQAFQECNRLLSISQNTHKGFISHESDAQSHEKSFPSQSSESQHKMNQAKLQEINSKSIEKRQKITLSIKNTFLSTFTQIKLKILNKEIRLALQNNFLYEQKKAQEEIAEAISMFLISENSNQKVKHRVVKCFQQKLQFYNLLLSKKGIKAQNLFNSAKILSNTFYKLEKQLLQQYSQFPSQKTQSINCFLQSELLNNYLIAYKLSNFSTISDEKLMNMKKNLKVNLFGKNVLSMILHVSDNLQTMEISSFSNGIHLFFSLTYEEFIKQNKNIDFLIPLAIRNEHYMLVQKFMNDGRSKYFRNIDLSFLQLPNGFLRPFNLIIDIILNHTEHLSFAVFFEEISLTSGFIMVDVNGCCGGFTQAIFERSGWRQSEIKTYYNQITNAYLTSINNIIPDFAELKEKKETKCFNVTVNLLTQRAITNFQTKSLTALHEIWNNSQNINIFKGTLIIWARELYGYYYYIIEIEDLRQNQTMSHGTTQQQDSKGYSLHFKDDSNIIEVSDLDVSLPEAEINKPQSLNIFQQSLSEFNNDNSQSIEGQINQINPKSSNLQQLNVSQMILANNIYQNYDDHQQDKNILIQNMVDVTPNQSIRKLIDTSKSFGQQRFFKKEIQELDQSNSRISEEQQNEIKGVNQLYEVDLNKIDREMRENIKLQLQIEDDFKNQTSQPIDDAASQVSSLIGLKKSIFYKKYELMNRLIEAKVMPTSYKFCLAFLSLSLIICIIHSIIVLNNLDTDFNRFIKEVDMLLFHYSFMTPFDVFLSLRFSTAYYSYQVSMKKMNSSDNTILSAWLASHLGEGYDDMKTNFLEQFSNPYLLDFFTDQTFDVYFMKENTTSVYLTTLTFRESLNVLLQYQYQFKIAYQQKIQLLSQPFIVYPYANYLNLHDKFDNMTNDILAYTLERKQMVTEKWTQSWIPLLLINFILIISCFFAYKSYLSNYEGFLNLFKYADESWILRDIERYKILIQILMKDSDVMFKYQFDLEQKEKFMMAEKYKKETKIVHEAKKKRIYNDFEKLPNLYGLIALAFLFSIFFICSLLITIQTNDYLHRYANTAGVYKFSGDLCFQCPGLFSQRQFLYWWQLYPIPVSEKPRMTARLFTGVQNLKQFNMIVQEFNQQDYLTTQSFLDQLDSIITKPVCDFFSDEQQQDYAPYCNTSFNGALTQGLTQAFIYAANQYEVTYALNNFTSIVQYYRYEAEGMYIMVKGLIELVSSLKVALLSATYSHMDQIQGFTLFIMLFSFFLLIVQYFIIHEYYSNEYTLVRRFMLLLPSSTLLLDDNFERKIRIFYAQIQI